MPICGVRRAVTVQRECRLTVTNDREHLLQAAGLRVRFVFRADPVAHEVQVADGADAAPRRVREKARRRTRGPRAPPFNRCTWKAGRAIANWRCWSEWPGAATGRPAWSSIPTLEA